MITPRPGARGAPSVTLPLRYRGAAAAAFCLAAASLPLLAGDLAGHYYHPHLLALAHTVGLGWITLSVMGATYQLVPIVLERPIWSERLARWQFVVTLVGIIGMVGLFWIAQWSGLVWAAGLVTLGLLAHLVNVGLSVRGLTRRTLTATLLVLALFGLGFTVALGLTLAASHLWPFLPGDRLAKLHAHFHLALLGWVAPMILGVAARVYPMFLLAPEPSGSAGRLQLWGLGLGVPVVAVGLLAAPPLVVPGAILVAAALFAHGTWVLGMVRRRKRPVLDWGLRFVLTGAAFVVPGTAMGVGFALGLLSGPRLALAYAVLALGGWISLTIVGMLLKIVPFLVWYRIYGSRVGRQAVPTLAALGWPAAEGFAYVLLTGGTVGLAVAVAGGSRVWIELAGSAIALGAIALAGGLGCVLRHLVPSAGEPSPAVTGKAAVRDGQF